MFIFDTIPGKTPAGYEEVLHWSITQQASRIVIMNILSIPLAVIFGIVFLSFIRIFGKPPETLVVDPFLPAVLIFGIAVVVVVHELAHGAAMLFFGAQPKYGVIWKGLMFYATAPGYAFQRNQYIVISLAPLVCLSTLAGLGIILQAGTSYVWLWAIWATINGSATIGDLWMTAIVFRYPRHAYIIDERDGIRIFLPVSNKDSQIQNHAD